MLKSLIIIFLALTTFFIVLGIMPTQAAVIGNIGEQNRIKQIEPEEYPVEPEEYPGKQFFEIEVKVLDTLLLISVIIALLANLVAGLQYILAGGDSAKAETAKKWLGYTMIGLVIVIFAYEIVHLGLIYSKEAANSGSGAQVDVSY